MAQRIKLGIIFSHDEGWIGGTYYILNLVQALNTLPTESMPTLVAFTSQEQDAQILKETGYPHLEIQSLGILKVGWQLRVNRFSQRLGGISLFRDRHPSSIAQYIFPYGLQHALSNIPIKIGWMPDFQEHYYPHFFTGELLDKRMQYYQRLTAICPAIILSSQASLVDFQKFYPNYTGKSYVLNFAVTHPDYQSLDIDALLLKHQISKPYFISPNQFWSHKNHIVILKALALYKAQHGDLPFELVFTGKEQDHRDPEYTTRLRNFVQAEQLDAHIRFLGFIDRKEQLRLMQGALAVLQPSKFEGWSTVVEDAKAMNQFIIASDILVHRQQLTQNYWLFDPDDDAGLCHQLRQLIQQKPQTKPMDYLVNRQKFALDLLEILKHMQP